MTNSVLPFLFLHAFGMASGQLLFKYSADNLSAGFGSRMLFQLLLSPAFLIALAIYAALTFLWVWILSFTPLTKAFPFVALSFIATPVLSALIFHEPLSWRYGTGLILVVAGLALSWGADLSPLEPS